MIKNGCLQSVCVWLPAYPYLNSVSSGKLANNSKNALHCLPPSHSLTSAKQIQNHGLIRSAFSLTFIRRWTLFICKAWNTDPVPGRETGGGSFMTVQPERDQRRVQPNWNLTRNLAFSFWTSFLDKNWVNALLAFHLWRSGVTSWLGHSVKGVRWSCLKWNSEHML